MKFAKPSSSQRVFNLAAVITFVSITGLTPPSAIGADAKAEPKVVAILSAGTTCGGAATANIKAVGAGVKVSLCVATTESLCGYTAKLQAANARESGRFHITALKPGAAFPDPNSALTFPIAITNPAANTDLGATVAGATASKAARLLLATFDISPQANATDADYTLNLAPNSSVGIGADGTCALPNDVPITANFKFINPSVKESKK